MTGTPTQFSTSDVQTRKIWSERMMYDSISDETLVGQMISDGTLVKKEDLSKASAAGSGDEIKYHFLARLSNKGLVGSQSATGNEHLLLKKIMRLSTIYHLLKKSKIMSLSTKLKNKRLKKLLKNKKNN